ncbi:DEAD/DEAH box helicase [Ruania halotolerans]|uniref:DEAD/DEAH box helicase n=1 Tax=Ruania halotolerans TaxID=2897773 RepID=UPI001E33C8B6|nr:DEAD/DEAH box helicase [Ruania halotolerans]UFU05162.1 DEAD/DEAH box helicase [Ruania halotolerans]
MTTSAVLTRFSEPTRTWFSRAFEAPTDAQIGAWEAIASGEHALVVAPTGSGKTLAAFLSALDRLLTEEQPSERARRCRVLYVSPLKALAADVERNLRSPLVGVTQAATASGTSVNDVQVGVRTGDTPAAERRSFATKPPDILITTPESLFLMLTSSAREGLRGVEAVIVDEVHALAGNKRGAHLALSLERLDALLERPAQRIGLSATVRPAEAVATYLCGMRSIDDGGRPVRTVQPRVAKQLQVDVVVPVPDLADLPGSTRVIGATGTAATAGAAGASRDVGAEASDAFSSTGTDSSGASGGAGASASAGTDAHSIEPDLSGDAAGMVPEGRTRPAPSGGSATDRGSIWPHVTERVVDLITSHTSTIVFTNSRRGAERLAARINECYAERLGLGSDLDPGSAWAAEIPAQSGTSLPRSPELPAEAIIARPHHGSMSRDERTATETALKNGTLPAVVATSSLELGIDMGAVDLVVQVGAPPSVASALQRIGRAGHHVGALSHGVVLPTHRGDLLAAATTAVRARAGAIEAVHVPTNPLDVLAQQIVAMCAQETWDVHELAALVRRAASFDGLSERVLTAVLDMLAGRYPSEEFAELRPRLVWDRVAGTVTGRPGTLRLAATSGGTIPDRGLYGVYVVGEQASARGGKRVGELDEEMVYESRVGDTFTLGSSTWRIEDITPDRVLVSPAPGLPGRLPFWKGDRPGRPAELGQAIGAMMRELAESGLSAESVESWGLDDWAAENLLAYLRDQERATGRLSTDRTLVVERFRDELGDWRVVIHSPYGAEVHAPWALILTARLREQFGMDVSAMHADDGIVLRLPDTDAAWAWGGDPYGPAGGGQHAPADGGPEQPRAAGELTLEDLLLDPDRIEADAMAALSGSAHFAARFREAAARSLLLPPRRPDRRQPLWQQRQRSAQLLAVAADYGDFPVVLEAVRECLQDDYDVGALIDLMRRVRGRDIHVVEVSTPTPSPFAQSLLFGYVAQFLYGEDTPLAERRAAALTLDADLLADLLGDGAEIADLLDPEALASVEAEVGWRTESSLARDPESLLELIRRLGPLDDEGLTLRSIEASAVPAWLSELHERRRILPVRVSGELRWAVLEDAGRLRDALGTALPTGLPEALTAPVPRALEDLVRRYARAHGPFRAGQLAQWYGLGVATVTPVLTELVRRGAVTAGTLRPQETHSAASLAMTGPDYCDADVLRRIRRRSLAALRAEVEAVPPERFGIYLPRWHQVRSLRGVDGVLTAIDQLAGTPVAASAWESLVLPARVSDYTPDMLDELTTSGEVVWVGAGSGPGADGFVALLPVDTVADLAPATEHPVTTPVHQAVLDVLSHGGGLFFRDVVAAVREAWTDREPTAPAVQMGTPDTAAPPGAGHPPVASEAPGATIETDAAGPVNRPGTADPLSPVRRDGAAPSAEDILTALWECVWDGRATNDSLAPLRARLGAKPRPGTRTTRRARPRGRSLRTMRPALPVPDTAVGRWSAVVDRSDAGRRATFAALALLDRDGLVTRGSAALAVPGGFGTAYRALATLEENGQVRRGYFVEGLGAAQFALGDAVERLRGAGSEPVGPHTHPDTDTTLLLAATDPANPYGAALTWPEPVGLAEASSAHRPGRKVGASVVLVAGVPVLYLERGARSVLSFTRDRRPLDAAAAELVRAAMAGTLGRFTVAKVDGGAALGSSSPAAEALLAAGFLATPSGLRIRRR